MIFDIRKHFEKTKFVTEEGTFRSQEGERKRGNYLLVEWERKREERKREERMFGGWDKVNPSCHSYM